MGRSTPVALALAAVAGLAAAPRQSSPSAAEGTRAARYISYVEARPVVERLAPELASSFASRPDPEREAAWRDWASRRDADIRARLARGDEDSVINLLRYGTSFTTLPRVPNVGSAPGGSDGAAGIVRGRIADFLRAIEAPGGNERLQFARDLFVRRGIDPATSGGREKAQAYLLAIMKRIDTEVASYAQTLASAAAQGRGELAVRSSLYRQRGLSSDTSIRPDFAIDRTLEALRDRGLLGDGSIRHVAIVGPGLDFTDKAEGHDFYPQQTTQPFLVIDSLRRSRLARMDGVTLTTIDLSPRVNAHLRAAQRRAADGMGYTLVLPRDRSQPWTTDFARFWRTTGGAVGDEARAIDGPRGVDVRAIRIRPEVVLSLRVHDMNVVVQRFDPPMNGDGFDLVIATNVLVYYDVLEQSLALANIAAMLRPGGVLLSNNVLVEVPATPVRSIGHTDAIYGDRRDDRDQIVWYQRQ